MGGGFFLPMSLNFIPSNSGEGLADSQFQAAADGVLGLLQAGMGVYTTVTQAKADKYTAHTNAVKTLQPGADGSVKTAVALDQKTLLIGGAVVVGLVLMFALRK